jgi:hypothetical protein
LTRVTNDPLINKNAWFLLMTTDREDYGFVVSFRHALVDQGKNYLAVTGVNRAEIESRSIINNIKQCSG